MCEWSEHKTEDLRRACRGFAIFSVLIFTKNIYVASLRSRNCVKAARNFIVVKLTGFSNPKQII